MSVGLDVLPIFDVINALPDPILIASREKIVGVNVVFCDRTGMAANSLFNVHLKELPFKKRIKEGLFRLFVKALHERGEGSNFIFAYAVYEKGIQNRNISATANRLSFAGKEYVIFTFKELPSQEILIGGDIVESWKSYLHLAYEPYMEFRPIASLSPFDEREDRTSYLKAVGSTLQVKYANTAAVKLYKGEGGTLLGETFDSLFHNEDDSLRFLDMLTIVGQMKAETTVNTHTRPMQVEMYCEVKFDRKGAVEAVYSGQRDLSGYLRYVAIIGGSRQEMDFVFNQPFTGFAFLEPPYPIERPEAENVDFQLDEILSQIIISRANQAIIDIHNTDKAKFLMKPMMALFADADVARQVLKELFVMRTTSVAHYTVVKKEDEERDEDALEHISIYRAAFDEADRMKGIFVATSKNHDEYKVRHRDVKND